MVLVPSAQTAASSIAMPARMSGEIIEAPRSRLGPATTARCGSHSTMRAPMEISLSTKNIRDFEHFLEHQHDPIALARGDDRDRHQVGGKRRPGLVFQLRHVTAEVVLDLHRLGRRHDQIIALDAANDAEPLKSHPDRAQMLDAGARDAQGRARDRGKPDQRADLDVIGADGIMRRSQRCRAVNHHGVGADAIDPRAERDQEMGEILHMRLGGNVAQVSRAVGGHRGDQRVFGGGDAWLVKKYIGALQA